MIRLAEMKDKDALNGLRRQVNELHVQGRPDIFKSGFAGHCESLSDLLHRMFSSD